MAILNLYCARCDKHYMVGSNAFKPFKCDRCGDLVTRSCEVRLASRSNWTPQSSKTPASKMEKFVIYSFIGTAAILVLGLIFGLFITAREKVQSMTTPTKQAVNTPNPIVETIPIQSTTKTPVADSLSSVPYQLCDVRIVNTLRGTDKTGGYKAVMDVQSKTLRLYYVGNQKEVIEVHYDGGGLNTMRLYRDSVLETTKTMYRRTDLEPNDKTIVYTSRTEQIKITITYN